MIKIVRFHQFGDANVLQLDELPIAEPKRGEVRLKVEAIGLNRAEVMFRQGAYLEQPDSFPSTLGYEAAGVIDAVGEGVTEFKIGDRISTIPAFSMKDYGVYGESAIAPVAMVAKYPEKLSSQEGTEATFDLVMNVNVKGVWYSMKSEIEHMLANGGGAIVNTSSIAGVCNRVSRSWPLCCFQTRCTGFN